MEQRPPQRGGENYYWHNGEDPKEWRGWPRLLLPDIALRISKGDCAIANLVHTPAGETDRKIAAP